MSVKEDCHGTSEKMQVILFHRSWSPWSSLSPSRNPEEVCMKAMEPLTNERNKKSSQRNGGEGKGG